MVTERRASAVRPRHTDGYGSGGPGNVRSPGSEEIWTVEIERRVLTTFIPINSKDQFLPVRGLESLVRDGPLRRN
jgi:hypothetical protein